MEFEIYMHLTMNVTQTLMFEPLICSINLCISNWCLSDGEHKSGLVVLPTLRNN